MKRQIFVLLGTSLEASLASRQAAEFPKLESARKRFQTVQQETGALIEAVARGAQ